MPGSAVKKILNSMRRHSRRTVVMPAALDVGDYHFDCMAYDISLGGVRLKVGLPIEQGTTVFVALRNKVSQAASVVWAADGFVGLSFNKNAEIVQKDLGNMVAGLS